MQRAYRLFARINPATRKLKLAVLENAEEPVRAGDQGIDTRPVAIRLARAPGFSDPLHWPPPTESPSLVNAPFQTGCQGAMWSE